MQHKQAHLTNTHNLALFGNYSSGRVRKRCCAGYEDQNYNILGYIVEKVCDPTIKQETFLSQCVYECCKLMWSST